MYPHSNWWGFSTFYSWDQGKSNAFPPSPHPLVSFLPSKKGYSPTTNLLMRALKRKLFWVSSHDLRWGNKTTSKYCRFLVSASDKIKYKWLELSCINGNRSFQGLPVFCWSNYTFKNKHVGLVSKVDLMLTHSFPIKWARMSDIQENPPEFVFSGICIGYTSTLRRFVIFTCRYFKLSWNTTALSQSNCRNFSCSSITVKKLPKLFKAEQKDF